VFHGQGAPGPRVGSLKARLTVTERHPAGQSAAGLGSYSPTRFSLPADSQTLLKAASLGGDPDRNRWWWTTGGGRGGWLRRQVAARVSTGATRTTRPAPRTRRLEKALSNLTGTFQ
jgi:hypothetical protein